MRHHEFHLLKITLISPSKTLRWKQGDWSVNWSEKREVKYLLLIWSSHKLTFQDILWIVDFQFCNPSGLAPSSRHKSVTVCYPFCLNSDLIHFWLFHFVLPLPWNPPCSFAVHPHHIPSHPGVSQSIPSHSWVFWGQAGCRRGVVSLGVTVDCWVLWCTAATDPLCWWWYLRVISPGTLCKLHREAEN